VIVGSIRRLGLDVHGPGLTGSGAGRQIIPRRVGVGMPETRLELHRPRARHSAVARRLLVVKVVGWFGSVLAWLRKGCPAVKLPEIPP
jgi:hypothetical protein